MHSSEQFSKRRCFCFILIFVQFPKQHFLIKFLKIFTYTVTILFEKNALLNKKQLGFKLESRLLMLCFTLLSPIETRKKTTGVLFLDVAKAFNSISNETFFKNAENFNLCQSTIILLNWVSTKRTHLVKFGIGSSEKIILVVGLQK